MSAYKKLFEGFEGIEGFDPVKAETLIEAHITQAIQTALDEQAEAHHTQIAEMEDAHEYEVSQLKESANAYGELCSEEALIESADLVDQHMSSFMNEWAEKNSASIDSQIRVQLAESLLSGIVDLVESHNITVPEGEDVLQEAEQQNAELRDALDEQIARTHELEKSHQEALRESAILRAGVGLTNTEIDRLTEMSKQFDYDDSFGTRLQTLRESLGSDDGTGGKQGGKQALNEGADANLADVDNTQDPGIAEVLSYLRRS